MRAAFWLLFNRTLSCRQGPGKIRSFIAAPADAVCTGPRILPLGSKRGAYRALRMSSASMDAPSRRSLETNISAPKGQHMHLKRGMIRDR